MAQLYLKRPLLRFHTDSPTLSPTSTIMTVIAQHGSEVKPQHLLEATRDKK